MVDFGAKLKQLRLEEGLTQQQLADRIGVTKSVISYYELQERYPSPEVLTKLASVFHVSTDYVFGSEGNTPRREDMPTNPLGVYGKTKLHGEQAIAEVGAKAIIIRTAWLYSEFGNNFLKTMLRLTAEKESLNVVFDQVGSPTYAGDLALAIFSIIEGGVYAGNEGIYHFSNEGVCSWYDFATEIAAAAGHECIVMPCHSNEFPSKVTRPPFSVLDKTKIKQTFGIEIPHWRESMIYCLKRIIMQQQAEK